jgi:hypothetical protein
MESKDDLIRFSTTQLSKLLGLPQQDAKEVTNYILGIESEAEVLKYLNVSSHEIHRSNSFL